MTRSIDASVPQFWRDAELPFIEARSVEDGRKICYDLHSHDSFSIGAITGGHSTYLNGRRAEQVGRGDVVLMNPEEVHACNPVPDEPWSYRMLYVDVQWLARLQHELGIGDGRDFTPLSTLVVRMPSLHAGLNHLYDTLVDNDAERLQKESTAVQFFTDVQQRIDPLSSEADIRADAKRQLQRAADYIDEHFLQPLKLDDICAAAGLSPSYLIRAFKKRYGMTPHAWQINRRIQYGRAQLRKGNPIADVAIETGFADQAHFQRTFKRLVAATPAQYRGPA